MREIYILFVAKHTTSHATFSFTHRTGKRQIQI